MAENIFIKLLFIIFIGVVVYLIYYFFYNVNLQENLKCNLDNYNIDDLVIIKRTPEYSKLINKMIDEKSFIFSNDQLNVLKNSQQIFNLENNNNQNSKKFNDNYNNVDIKNISENVYLNCQDQLKNNMFDFDPNNSNNSNNSVESFDNLIDVSSKEYVDIKNMLKKDIERLIGPNCYNTGVLKKNMPLIKNYLKNYYQDIYGNKINAELDDYFTAYYTLINNDDNVGLPVNTLIGHSNFIIPDQYNYDSHFTNAYNIDWSRIINPWTYS